ncbi:MAG: 50S ribosomal protein L22 [Nanoarchaeota archaeon]|nr:50S ribosomal protein L22 [Nanoarchaeota archaeon]MBU4283791.1 50S ribosomal protein L22 [Nanoarchaeota archaeon]
MSQYKYSAAVNEHRAKAVGLLMSISTKQSIEICNLIRRKNLQKAKKILNEVIDMKKPVPFKRFTEGAGHKHGIGPGKYPVKACREILNLVNLVEANAQHKGLDTSSLEIIHICAKKGPKSWHYGRQSRIAMKRTHVEIVVEEKEFKKEIKKELKKEELKPIKKQEEKKEIEEKPKEEVKEKHEKEIKEEEPEISKEIKERAETKKEQPKEIEKPAEVKKEEKKEGKQEGKSQSKQEPKKVLKEKKVPTATELAEKAKSKQEPKKVPTINELTKKKESKEPKKTTKSETKCKEK